MHRKLVPRGRTVSEVGTCKEQAATPLHIQSLLIVLSVTEKQVTENRCLFIMNNLANFYELITLKSDFMYLHLGNKRIEQKNSESKEEKEKP